MGSTTMLDAPGWNDPGLKAGTMVRAALWLIGVVGVGNTFTKKQLRAAFPSTSQIDRRMRDLRAFGWVIHTSSDDVALKSDEHRFIKMGLPLWDPQLRRTSNLRPLSDKKRRAVLASNDYLCVVCGIAGGDGYPDDTSVRAILSISRRKINVLGGGVETQFVSECNRCRAGSSGITVDSGQLLSEILDLSNSEQAMLLSWAERGSRDYSPIDRVWSLFRRLPPESRGDLISKIRSAEPRS